MEHGSVEAVRKHVKVYIAVFAALAVLTVVTVAVSYLDLSVRNAVIVALFIATIKSSLVACFFMHLITERKVILYILLVTFVCFIILMILPNIDYF